MELADKDFKTAIINNVNMFKDSKKNRNTIKREMEDIQRTKWKF